MTPSEGQHGEKPASPPSAPPIPQDSAQPAPPPPPDSSPFEQPTMQDVSAGLGFPDPSQRRPPRGR
jgi:hypothetical protein